MTVSRPKVLVLDVGGTHVKALATGRKRPVKFDSGAKLTPSKMVAGLKRITRGWEYDVVSMGYPGVVRRGRIVADPHNLGPGWVDFDFAGAFKRPVRIINDAAMQALGSYRGGTMLFLGLGTGLGSAMVADGVVVPLELGHLVYKRGVIEDYVGLRGLERLGKKKWIREVRDAVKQMIAAFETDDVVLGGGNVKKLKKLPRGARRGDNANAFLGGFRLWEDHHHVGAGEDGLKAGRRKAGPGGNGRAHADGRASRVARSRGASRQRA